MMGTNNHTLGSLKQQKCILSQVWRLEVPNLGIRKTMLPLKALGKNSLLPSLWWLLAILGILWLISAPIPFLTPHMHDLFFLWMSLLYEGTGQGI